MSQGFIQIPRSLLDHPAIRDCPHAYFRVLITILEYACFLPCQQCDHGKIIDLLPGQFMCSERRLAELAGVTKNDVHRSLIIFSKLKIVNQEVNQRKNILTITHKETYDLIKQYSEPRSEPKKNQERTIKRYNDNEDKEDKEESIIDESSIVVDARSILSDKKKEEEIEAFEALCSLDAVTFTRKEILLWFKKYSLKYIEAHYRLMLLEKDKIRNPSAWLQKALDSNYIDENILSNKRRMFAESLREKGWNSLKVVTRYCRDENTGKDYYYNLPNFEEYLEMAFENRNHA